MKVAIIGTGVVGSYVYGNCVSQGYEADIFDCGDLYVPRIKELGGYNGLSKGRRFGLYGTALLWGGQFNFISDEDLLDLKETKYLSEALKVGRTGVIKEFFGNEKNCEKEFPSGVKIGYWLWPWKRNTAKRYLENKKIIKDVIHSIKKSNTYFEVKGKQDNYGNYDRIYLCAGAFESNRILVQSALAPESATFTDHVSAISHNVKLNDKSNFLKRLKPKIGQNGLVTFRYVIKGGFVHLLFNNEIKIFSFIKKIIFKLDRKVKINSWFSELKFLIFFPVSLLFGRFYVDKSACIALDIDNSGGSLVEKNGASLVDWAIKEDAIKIFKEEQSKISVQLAKEGVEFKEVEFKPEKFTDTFHPTCINSDLVVDYFNCEVKGIDGLHVFSTGILPGGYSSNPTASVMALVKAHFNGF